MKRIATLVLMLCIACSAFADNVSQSRAESLAKAFFSSTATKGKDVKVEMVWNGQDASTRSGEAPAFYVFNREGGGFVVISGEDAAVPVLGYSETGSFKAKAIRSNVKGWFDMYSREVAYLRSIGERPDSEMEAQWAASAIKSNLRRAGGKNLNTKSWGQDAPYNLRCPVVDGLQSVTGCVATAVCEVMRYHEWPQTVTGTLPSYKYKTDKGTTRTEPSHRLDTTYNWSKMPNDRYSYTQEQAQNVSKLMFDVAVMLQSNFNGVDNYGAYGTGAYSEYIVPMMVHYMDYDSSAVLLYRNNYSTLRWSEILKAEIDGGRPMPYAGDDNESGHQFVVDGYDGNGNFHINWGWDGDDNGFFTVSSFRIGSDYDFRYNQTAVIGLQKNQGGTPHEPQLSYYVETGTAGVSLVSGTIESGSFTMRAGDFYNFGAFDVDADFAFVLMDYADNVKKVVATPDHQVLEFNEGAAVDQPCTLSVTDLAGLAFGDKLVFCYKLAGGNWTKILVDSYSNPGISEYPIYDAPCIKVNATATYSASEIIPLEIVNNRTAPSSVTWYIDGVAYGDTEARLEPGVHTIKCVARFNYVNHTLVQQIKVNP